MLRPAWRHAPRSGQVKADLVGWAGVGFGGRGGSVEMGDGFAQGEQFGDLRLRVCQAESDKIAYVFAWWLPGVADL